MNADKAKLSRKNPRFPRKSAADILFSFRIKLLCRTLSSQKKTNADVNQLSSFLFIIPTRGILSLSLISLL
jgi:hypothetical protein